MHNLKNLNMTPEQSVAGFAFCVEAAKENGIAISGSISMPFASPWEGRTPVEDVDAIIEAYLNVGINEISLSDASGMAVPNQVYDLYSHVRQTYPECSWWLHFHNTRGMAMANILSALEAGMTQFDSSFGGLGGCPFVPGRSRKYLHRGRAPHVRGIRDRDRNRHHKGHRTLKGSPRTSRSRHGQLYSSRRPLQRSDPFQSVTYPQELFTAAFHGHTRVSIFRGSAFLLRCPEFPNIVLLHLLMRNHILHKDPISPRRIVDKHMGHSTDEFAVLDNW